jgi:flagellar basal-body rod protein FlgG
MLESLYIGATGMQAQQFNLDAIANNLVNVNTPGFKKGRVSFVDLVVSGSANASPLAQADALTALVDRVSSGAGVGISRLARSFEIGDLRKTDAPFDVAIQGDGFIEVALPDGGVAYMRGGSLKINKDGLLANSAGEPLRPNIPIPPNVQTMTIERDGTVLIRVAGEADSVEAGRIELVRFVSTAGLEALGEGTYRSTIDSGEAIPIRAGDDGAGGFAQGFLEGANVRMVDEMVNLMLAQRAYEASVKVVQASDEMLGLVNAMRK